MKNRPWFKHYFEGQLKEVEIPEVSLPRLLEDSLDEFRDHTIMTYYNRTFTLEEFSDIVNRLASAFTKEGVKKGDRIALMVPNTPYYAFTYFAALKCGAIIVQVNPMYKPYELEHILNDSGAEYMVAYEPLEPIIQAVKDRTKLSKIYYASDQNVASFNKLLQDEGDQVPEVDIDPRNDVAVLQYTGGTTGKPKGVMLTHRNLIANTIQTNESLRALSKPEGEKVLMIIPLFHVYGASVLNTAILKGNNLILLPRFEVEEVVETIQKHKPTNFPGVPTMFIALLDYAKKHNIKLDVLETCSSGAGPLPVEVMEQFNEVAGASVAEGYGLSEASPTTHRNPIVGLQKNGSIGIPLPSTDAKIVDRETGKQEMPVGEVGELIIQGPQVMKGYWNMPEETEETIRDGWLYTGDLAKMDEDGFFYIVGRTQELIIASGYNVYPIEIENVLYEHPKVLEAAVYGVPDDYRGETVQATIVPQKGVTLTEEEIVEFCSERLAAYKVPKIIEFRDELPVTTTGKVLKRVLQEEAVKGGA